MKNKMKSMLSAALALTLSFSVGAGAASVTDFQDVSSSDWYYESVGYAVSNNLFNGTSSTTFSPSAPMTRAMFVTVLGRLDGVDTSKYNSTAFADIADSAYYKPYVAWASAKGIVNGTSTSTFSPDGQITREQIAKILYGYAVDKGVDTPFTTTGKATYEAFGDYTTVSEYASHGMRWCVQENIVKGSAGKLEPQGTATRAQVAQILMNADTLLKSTSTSKPSDTDTTDTNTTKPNDTQTETPTQPDTNIDYNIDEIGQRKTGVSAKDAQGGYWHYDLMNATFDEVNKLREKEGKKPLNFSIKMESYAEIRSYELGVMNYDKTHGTPHIRPDGSAYQTVGAGVSTENALYTGDGELGNPQYDANGIVYYNKYETIPHGLESETVITRMTYQEMIDIYAEELAQQWYNSAGHKATMINTGICGAVGIYVKDGNLYAVQLFSNQTVNTVNSYSN